MSDRIDVKAIDIGDASIVVRPKRKRPKKPATQPSDATPRDKEAASVVNVVTPEPEATEAPPAPSPDPTLAQTLSADTAAIRIFELGITPDVFAETVARIRFETADVATINVANLAPIPLCATAVWKAVVSLNRANPRLYRYGNAMVRIQRDARAVLLISALTPRSLKYELERVAHWIKTTDDGVIESNVPTSLVLDVLETTRPDLPSLVRIAHTPTFDAKGNVIATRGFHSESGIYYDGDLVDLEIPASPTSAEVANARRLLLEIVQDFPFATEADRTNALALLALPFARGLFTGPSPLRMISKPSQGTGATLLAQTFALIATGKDLLSITEGGSDDEWRKRITSTLLDNPDLVCCDNLHGVLNSAALCSLFTCTTWHDRRLGKSENLGLPNYAAWCATANNPQVSGEMARRIISIRMDAQVDRPWQRAQERFLHPHLLDWARERREDLVRSILLIIKSWIAAGRPDKGVPTLGMFEAWARCIGGILTHAGVKGFLGNLETFYADADDETEAWRAFVAAWFRQYGEAAATVAAIGQIAKSVELTFGGRNDHAEIIRLGNELRKRVDCVLGEFQIERSGRGSAGVQYRVRRVKNASPGDQQTEGNDQYEFANLV